MSEKETLTLLGIELGVCSSMNDTFFAAIQCCDFEASEIGKSLGLEDSKLLQVDLYTGEIISFSGEDTRTKLNHTISLCMNVPVTGEVGE